MHFHEIIGLDNKTQENHANAGTVQKIGQRDIVVNLCNKLSIQLSCKATKMTVLTTMNKKRQYKDYKNLSSNPHSRRTYLYPPLTI
jgi:hypothetical protein